MICSNCQSALKKVIRKKYREYFRHPRGKARACKRMTPLLDATSILQSQPSA